MRKQLTRLDWASVLSNVLSAIEPPCGIIKMFMVVGVLKETGAAEVGM